MKGGKVDARPSRRKHPARTRLPTPRRAWKFAALHNLTKAPLVARRRFQPRMRTCDGLENPKCTTKQSSFYSWGLVMSNWRAIQCNTQRETVALDNLEGIGVPCFFPYRRVRRWRRHRTTWHKSAYFPGYLFADLERHRPLGNVIGVERVLGEVDIAESIIDSLKGLAEPDGRILEPLLKRGDTVHLGNLVAELESLDERSATVLIPIFGNLFPATVTASRVLNS